MATCLWFQFSDGQFSRLKVADSREGMFSHDDTIVTESIFVAKSSNFPLDRRGRIRKVGRFGFRNYLNPALLSGVSFKGFTGELAEGGSLYALGLRRVGGKSLYTGGSNLSFPETPFEGRIGEHKNDGRQFLYRDWTGSITSSAGSYVVSDLPHMVSSQCRPWSRLSADLPLLVLKSVLIPSTPFPSLLDKLSSPDQILRTPRSSRWTKRTSWL